MFLRVNTNLFTMPLSARFEQISDCVFNGLRKPGSGLGYCMERFLGIHLLPQPLFCKDRRYIVGDDGETAEEGV